MTGTLVGPEAATTFSSRDSGGSAIAGGSFLFGAGDTLTMLAGLDFLRVSSSSDFSTMPLCKLELMADRKSELRSSFDFAGQQTSATIVRPPHVNAMKGRIGNLGSLLTHGS